MSFRSITSIIIALILSSTSINAQSSGVSPKADSLIALLPTINNDSLLLSTYLKISRILNVQNPSEAFKYNRIGLEKSMLLDDIFFKAPFCNEVAISYYHQGHIDSALYHFKRSAAYFQELGKTIEVSHIEGNVGIILIEKGEYQKAIVHYEQLLIGSISNNDSSSTANYIGNIALAYDYLGDYEKALEFYLQSLKISKEIKDSRLIQQNLGNVGALYSAFEEDEKAKAYFREAIPLNIKFNNNNELARNYQNLGVIFDYEEKNDSALLYHNKAIEIYKTTNNREGIGDEYLNIGVIYEKINQLDEAEKYYLESLAIREQTNIPERLCIVYSNLGSLYQKKKQYNLSENYLKKAENIALELGLIMRQKEIYGVLSDLHESKGDYQKALWSYQSMTVAADSLLNNEKNEAIAMIEEKFETKERIAENEQLKADKLAQAGQIKFDRQIKVLGTSGIVLLVFLLFMIYLFYYKQRKTSATLQDKNDQIHLLNREMNHRVKNNLAFMTGLFEMQARRVDNTEAKAAIKESESRLRTLSLVHTTLFKNKNTGSLQLKPYLIELADNLESIFNLPGKNLVINTEIQDINLDAEDTMRIGLIVNELITNSIKHAFYDIERPKISIEIKKDPKGKLLLNYTDNGFGFTKETYELKKGSLGLKLIRLLTEQMEGEYEMEHDKELLYRFSFLVSG